MLNLLKWFGGKGHLIKYILPLPYHTTYVEVFFGGGTVFFNKQASQIEVINDINARLVNLYKTIVQQPENFIKICIEKGLLDSRDLFNEYLTPNPEAIQDAFQFFYVNRHSFSGNMIGFHGVSTALSTNAHRTYWGVIEKIPVVAKRLAQVVIENQDFRSIIKRFDVEGALLYLDPPYFKGGELYEKIEGGNPWGEKEFDDLYDLLGNLKKAKFIMSIDSNDTRGHDWNVQAIERINNFNTVKPGQERSVSIEYLIRNFDPAYSRIMVNKNQKRLGAYFKNG